MLRSREALVTAHLNESEDYSEKKVKRLKVLVAENKRYSQKTIDVLIEALEEKEKESE